MCTIVHNSVSGLVYGKDNVFLCRREADSKGRGLLIQVQVKNLHFCAEDLGTKGILFYCCLFYLRMSFYFIHQLSSYQLASYR